MAIDPKLLTEGGWKAIATKFKIKDNGLQRALASYEKLEDDDYDDCLKGIGSISQLAGALKKAKDVAAAADALKYLNSLTSAADAEKSDVAKAKAAADKAQAEADKAKIAADKAQVAADKAKAAADKAAADEAKRAQDEEDEDDEEEGDYKAKLLAAFGKVKTAKDQVYQFIVCDTKPHCGVMIAKRISPQIKAMLTEVTGGGKKFLKPGTCEFAGGRYVFSMEQPVAGLARKLQDSIKNFTGKKFPIMVGTESADDDEQPGTGQAEAKTADAPAAGGPAAAPAAPGAAAAAPAAPGAPAAAPAAPGAPAAAPAAPGAPEAAPAAAGAPAGRFSISASVGQGGKNKAQDVMAVQTALNGKGKAGLVVDGKCGPKTIAAIKAFQQTLGKFKPDGLIEVGRASARVLAGAAVPAPPPEPPKPVDAPKLGKGSMDTAAGAWKDTLGFLSHNFDAVKKAAMNDYCNEHPTLVKAIETNLKKFDGVIDNLGTELGDALAAARAARDAVERKTKLQACKNLVMKQIAYVKSEPLLDHIDRNPWVTVNCKKGLVDCLVHVSQAIGKVG